MRISIHLGVGLASASRHYVKGEAPPGIKSLNSSTRTHYFRHILVLWSLRSIPSSEFSPKNSEDIFCLKAHFSSKEVTDEYRNDSHPYAHNLHPWIDRGDDLGSSKSHPLREHVGGFCISPRNEYTVSGGYAKTPMHIG